MNGVAPSSPTTIVSHSSTQTQNCTTALPQITIPNGVIHSPTHHHSPTSHQSIAYPPHHHHQFIMDASAVPTHDKLMPRVLTPIGPAQGQYVELFIV